MRASLSVLGTQAAQLQPLITNLSLASSYPWILECWGVRGEGNKKANGGQITEPSEDSPPVSSPKKWAT